MSTKLPYVIQPGGIVKILEKARQAQTPERFTTDFLETKLGFRGGNYRQFIPFAKKLGLLGSDGRPTDIYKSYRNAATSGAAMAQALRIGYREAFERNEYANNLPKDEFKGLVLEITGLAATNRIVQLVCQTFDAVKKLANFDTSFAGDSLRRDEEEQPKPIEEPRTLNRSDVGLNLAYIINLVLPKTDDPAVFTAIFRALRENLLSK